MTETVLEVSDLVKHFPITQGIVLQRKIAGLTPRTRVVCAISGGNIDVNIIARIIERGLVKEGRRVMLSLRVPDRRCLRPPRKLLRCAAVVGMQPQACDRALGPGNRPSWRLRWTDAAVRMPDWD